VSTGRVAHINGLAAEEIAARVYLAEGARLLATRWRCAEGEIDLIVGFPELLVFVEVKARRHRDAAAFAIRPAQWRRLAAAASRYLQGLADPATACRFDVVLVDRSGRAERIENAASFDEW
jgi:putative endonuclease